MPWGILGSSSLVVCQSHDLHFGTFSPSILGWHSFFSSFDFCIGIGVYGARLTPRVCFGSFSLDIRGTVFSWFHFLGGFIYWEAFDLHWVNYLPSWFFIWSLGFYEHSDFIFIFFLFLRQKVVCLFMHNFACNMGDGFLISILDLELFSFHFILSFSFS